MEKQVLRVARFWYTSTTHPPDENVLKVWPHHSIYEDEDDLRLNETSTAAPLLFIFTTTNSNSAGGTFKCGIQKGFIVKEIFQIEVFVICYGFFERQTASSTYIIGEIRV